jgi:branched-chain amino acid aminotransferase
VKGNDLLTPPLSAGALYGITRGTVMDLARAEGMAVSEPNLTRYDVFNADECFLTGTGAELIPVIKVDGRVIGTGKPGPATRKFIEKYRALVNSVGEPIF